MQFNSAHQGLHVDKKSVFDWKRTHCAFIYSAQLCFRAKVIKGKIRIVLWKKTMVILIGRTSNCVALGWRNV